MARISQYQVDTNISDNDQLLGSDAEDANVTKRFTVGDLAAYINGESSGSPGSGTVTSVTGTGTVSGITLSGNVTESGSLTLGGSLSLTSQEIINFLGYTPSSFDGDYNSLTNQPSLFDGAYNSLTGKPVLFDGDYDSLTNQPTIPAASAILANSGTPTLATGITAEEIRTLIGAGDGTGSIESVTGTAPIVSSGGANPAISISAATTSAAGSMSASDKTKLDGIDAGAQVNVATNLSYATAATTGTVASSTGTNATIPAATTSLAGLMTNVDKTKLDGIDNVTTNFVKNTNDTFSASPKVNQIVTLTQAEYDNTNKYAEYLYIIVD